jgi:hypothetical protein
MTTTIPTIQIPRLRSERFELLVTGSAPLLIHDWRARMQAAGKSPEQMLEDARIKDARGNDAVYAAYFKAAVVRAAELLDELPKTVVRGALFVGDPPAARGRQDELVVALEYDEMVARKDTVELAGGAFDFYRPEYRGWRCRLPIHVNASVLRPEQTLMLFEVAGARVGIGRRRPEENGTFGTFEVG